MALRLTTPSVSPTSFPNYPRKTPNFPPLSRVVFLLLRPRPYPAKTLAPPLPARRSGGAVPRVSPPQQEQRVEEEIAREEANGGEWGKVSAVLFDMDGVLCNSEEPSRMAAVDVFAEMGVSVTVEDFVPFMGTGEANFLGGVASAKGVIGFDPEAAKKRFFEIYLDKYAKPNSGIGFPGALELIMECKRAGLKVAVASSADRIKVDANLAAAGLPASLFDAIVSADAFENLKPAPDIFLAASKILNVDPSECLVIEDALAGVQAAKAARMRCVAVTTTLTYEELQQASPSLIRKDIGNVLLNDILYGGPSGRKVAADGRMQNPQNISSLGKSSSEQLNGALSTDFAQEINAESEKGHFLGGFQKWSVGRLQGSRRDILRYGSLGIAVSSLIFTISNWKAMQYASPKGLLNFFKGNNRSILGQNEGDSRSSRIQQVKNYLADLEARGSASNVPEFPPNLDWLNTAPLRFRTDLKGKVVLLDFWTYCCINCMHVLPDLEYLEKKYSNKPFTVIGVHSAKFDNEKDLEAIRNAVLRYNITHPVVNDGDMYLWRELGVNSWPTFVIIGPNGKILAQLAGEGHRKDLDDFVDASLQFYGEKNPLENNPIPLALEKDNDGRLITSPLKFPGKLAIDAQNNRLFISDSNHNRIVVADLEGTFITQIGSTGEEGLNDGTFDSASFNRPQGLAYNPKKNLLYVADTENHALREIDFVNETVRTLAGNGTKGSDYKGGGRGTAQARSTTTSFAQPSGISLSSDMQEVYIADSESSSIRAVNLKTGGSRLLAGGDPVFPENLFRFGDHDGAGSEVLLQHPLGIVCGKDNQIYIADSYNHKVVSETTTSSHYIQIKKLDPITKRVTTLAGTGRAGFKDGPAFSAQARKEFNYRGYMLFCNKDINLSRLSEPAGIVEAENGKLLIADTNNNAIRYLDLNEKDPVLRTLELKGVQPPSSKPKSLKRLRRRLSADTKVIKVDGGSSKEGYFYIAFSVPDGYHFSKEARSKFDVEIEPANTVDIDPLSGYLNPDGSASLHFRRISPLPAMGRINCKVYYCKEDEVCLYQSVAFDVSFQSEKPESNPADIRISYSVVPRVTPGTSQLILANKNG
ncbi:NHL repeat-containing protein 2 [Ananas comosus]|uniref:NHL repeat-containing protein 2 n=1 Tax=Ananas comosus TaxID=4615 RepID=A0A199VXK1_ANACO|nr:NHL repeat-containing protein 2 [Ananas comosus]